MLSMYYYRSVYDTCQYLDKKIHALKGLTACETACQAGPDTIEGTLTGKNFLLMIPGKYYLCLLFHAATEGFQCVWLASLTGVLWPADEREANAWRLANSPGRTLSCGKKATADTKAMYKAQYVAHGKRWSYDKKRQRERRGSTTLLFSILAGYRSGT
jgi:hypothetical protein